VIVPEQYRWAPDLVKSDAEVALHLQ